MIFEFFNLPHRIYLKRGDRLAICDTMLWCPLGHSMFLTFNVLITSARTRNDGAKSRWKITKPNHDIYWRFLVVIACTRMRLKSEIALSISYSHILTSQRMTKITISNKINHHGMNQHSQVLHHLLQFCERLINCVQKPDLV